MKEFIKRNLESGKPLRKFVDFFHFLYLSFANHIVSKIPFYFLRTFIYRYFYFMKIGNCSHIQMGLRVYAPWKIKIGNNCAIGNDCFLDGRRGILIGNNVDIASNVKILTLLAISTLFPIIMPLRPSRKQSFPIAQLFPILIFQGA